MGLEAEREGKVVWRVLGQPDDFLMMPFMSHAHKTIIL
jgi:hypothetical protein